MKKRFYRNPQTFAYKKENLPPPSLLIILNGNPSKFIAWITVRGCCYCCGSLKDIITRCRKWRRRIVKVFVCEWLLRLYSMRTSQKYSGEEELGTMYCRRDEHQRRIRLVHQNEGRTNETEWWLGEWRLGFTPRQRYVFEIRSCLPGHQHNHSRGYISWRI